MKKKALIIGGSGGLSGRLAVLAQEQYDVWTLTRGKRPLPEGVTPILADREDSDGFQATVFGQNTCWDVVFDCICMNELHAEQDLQILSKITDRLIVVSTDSVYDPSKKHTPQNEQGIFIEEQGAPSACSYAGNKRKMEHVFLNYFNDSTGNLQVTLFRPGHIYGPGFLLGCFPEHSRQEDLLQLIRNKKPLRLVGGGIYLTQPIFVDDLANAMLNCVDKEKTYNEIFCIGGPEAVENKRYYEIIGELLGTTVTVTEVPLTGYVETHPGYAGHLCHRIYDLSKLRDTGVPLPSTTLYDGMKQTLKL